VIALATLVSGARTGPGVAARSTYKKLFGTAAFFQMDLRRQTAPNTTNINEFRLSTLIYDGDHAGLTLMSWRT
jgi:hypothetical protein